MKRLFLLLVFCSVSVVHISSQTVVYNGEDIGVGIWTDFLVPVSEVDNPSKDAVNESDKCLSILRLKDTDEWAGTRAPSLAVSNITNYGKITMMVKKSKPGLVQMEIQTAGETRKEFLSAYYLADALNTWQNLEFNLPANSLGNESVEIILVSIHRENTRDDVSYNDEYMYLDEIVLHPKETSAEYDGENKGVGMWDPFLVDVREVDNPDKTGVNTSDKCLEINRLKDKDPWSGARAPRFKMTNLADYTKITMMVKKNVAGLVKLEIQTKDESKKEFLEAEYTAENVGQWKKLEFTIPENALGGDPLEIILLQIHVADTRDDASFIDQLMYIDELKFVSKNETSIEEDSFDTAKIVSSTLYSIAGKVIEYSNSEIDPSVHSSGIYIVKEVDVNGNINNRKIITK